MIGIEVVSDWEGLHCDMPQAWKQFKDRVKEIQHRVDDEMMDMSLDYDGKHYTQLICVKVKDVRHVPASMVSRVIPPQTYIHKTHRGPVHNIARTFGLMYDWAEKHGYKTSHFKIDIGYTMHGVEETHDLYVQVICSC